MDIQEAMMGASPWIHLEDCRVIRTTDAAILIEYEGEELWCPRSQVSEGDKYEAGDGENDGVTISITTWLARKHGIEAD